MSTQKICDYCGQVINESFRDYRGDLDKNCLAVVEIKVVSLSSSRAFPSNPDLCRLCIIKVLRG